MSEFIDLKDLNKKSEIYDAFVYFNSVIRTHEENNPGKKSWDRINEALSIARKHNIHYLNEDGEFQVGSDGKPLTKEPSLVDSMRHAFGIVQLTVEEKVKFRNEFLGACFNHKANL
ncbi:hypothetical protein ABNM11_24955 [Pseudomonas syringae]